MRVAPGGRAGGASPLRASPTRPCWPVSSGLLAAYAGSAAVTAVVALAGGTRHPAAALGAYGLLAAVVAASTRPAAAAGVALIAWMFDNGFIVGRHADLGWHGEADARRLAILLAAAAAAAMFGSRIRRASQGPLPPRGPATAVDTGQGIPDRHPVPAAHAPAAAAPAITATASNKPDDGGVLIAGRRPAA
jgi:hypothetical protein